MDNYNVMVDAVVFIKNGCPIEITVEGSDFIGITCGNSTNDRFEFSIEHGAMRKFTKLCVDAVAKMDGDNPE